MLGLAYYGMGLWPGAGVFRQVLGSSGGDGGAASGLIRQGPEAKACLRAMSLG